MSSAADARTTPSRATYARMFWLVAAGFALVMSFMTVPTPLYGLYGQRDGFGTLTVTLVFAAYGVGVLVGLVLLGHISDHLGRRPVVAVVVVVEILCAVAFARRQDLGPLLVLRFVTGLGVGAISSTVTAQLAELHGNWRPDSSPDLGRTVATVANVGGLAIGPLVAALLSFLPGEPLSTPYWAYALLMLPVLAVVALTPETVAAQERAGRWRYRPQRIAVEPDVRPAFVGAAVAAMAGFAVLGFVTSLTGRFLTDTLGITSRLTIGAVATTVILGSAVSQVALVGLSLRRRLQVGAALVLAGMAGLSVAALLASLSLFIVGGVAATGGVGLIFAASVATVSRLSRPESRGETLAALFTAAYVGITVPVIAVGLALTVAGTVPVLLVFAVVIMIAVPVGIALLLARLD